MKEKKAPSTARSQNVRQSVACTFLKGTVRSFPISSSPTPMVSPTSLKKAFEAQEIGRTVVPNKRLANIRIRIGTSTFMISEVQEAYKPTHGAYYLYVENADITYKRISTRLVPESYDE
jgi:hypothetical protein